MLRRLSSLALVAAAALLGAWLVEPAPEPAEALVPSQIVGAYRVKLKGWANVRSSVADGNNIANGKVNTTGLLLLSHPNDDPSARAVQVTLRLDKRKGALAAAAPDPVIDGARGFIVGDGLQVLDAASSVFVNALSLRFEKRGKKITGVYLSSFPATDADRGFTSAIHAGIKGRRLKLKADELSNLSALRALSR